MRAALLVIVASLAAGCDETPPAATPAAPAAPACPAAAMEVAGGLASADAIAPRIAAVVTRDFDPHACLVRARVDRESMLVEASHEGETIRARLASSLGTPTEPLTGHLAAHRLFHALLDAGLESALSTGRGVVLGYAARASLCYRASATDARCVQTAPVLDVASVTEPSVGRLIVRARSGTGAGVEWEVVTADQTTTSRTAPLQPGRALGAPPPDLDRFARVRSASSEAVVAPTDEPATAIAEAMPPGAATVRLDSRVLGTVRVFLLSRCEGLLAHCVSMIATRDGTTLRVSPSFGTDASRIDEVLDASTFAPGALRVRVLEEGFHEASASELIVTVAGSALDVVEVAIGHETERGEGETITEGCYRSLSIEGPGRVRLSGARGWSGSHSDARGWNVVPSTSCATDATLCLGASGLGASGLGPCP